MPDDSRAPSAHRLLTPPAALAPGLAALPGVRHGFFGMEGGVSTGLYASLNAGAGSQDDPEAVSENRRRIAAALSVAPEKLISVNQVHSATAVRVAGPLAEKPRADAMATATPALALAILTADCTPILMADVEAGVIGAAHAGWRGAISGVVEAALAEMLALGARPERIAAAIGPTIAQPSYEVGEEFRAQFLATDPDAARFFTPGPKAKPHFDLPGFCAARLARAGVTVIEPLGRDTYPADSGYFSNRRNVHSGIADYGRNCAAIVLAG